ncbi:MAG: molybdopterin guanine dinucleotide-containing S/N-oxide reductase [Dongiaceae bacterium]
MSTKGFSVRPAAASDDMQRFASSSHWGAIQLLVRGEQVVGVEPFYRDSDPSPIIRSLPGAIHDDRTRIGRPMIRAGWLEAGWRSNRSKRGAEPFVAVSWAEALDLVAEELRRVKAGFGNEAIYGGSYGWGSAGRFHNAPTQLHRFLNLFGGFTASVNSYSCAAAIVLMPHVLGDWYEIFHQLTDWRSIADNTRLIVAFGGMPLKNAQVAAGGCGDHSAKDWMRRCRMRGAAVVYVGPVQDDMADFLEAEWLQPRPNTDTAVMLGIAHTLLVEGLHDTAFLERYSVGFERFRRYLTGESDGRPKDAEWAAGVSGLDSSAIRHLARRMAGQRTLLTVSWSLQRADHGEQAYWMAVTLAAMLGQIGLPGGGIGFGYAAVGNAGQPADGASRARLPQGVNPVQTFIPVARIADMLLTPGESVDYNGRRIVYPDIHVIYWCGGNPFHHHQDLNRLLAAWRKAETVIVHEPWWTPLARHADIVLPASTACERNDIGGSVRDPYVLAMQRAIMPVGDARSDFDIFVDLAERLGFRAAFTEGRDEMEWLRHLYDHDRQAAAGRGIELPGFQEFWECGHVEIPAPERPTVLFEAFRTNPDAHPLSTPSGKIEIYSETVASFGYDDCPGHPVWIEPLEWLGSARARRHPLHLISNQPRFRLHGQLDNGVVSRKSKIQDREPIWIHPDDAAGRGISDGDIVRVFNDRGSCLAGAFITDRIQRGVVQLATGAWYDPERPGEIGTTCKHGSVNVLTLDKGTSKLAQGPSAQSCLVDIERYRGDPPPVTAFDPPEIIDRPAAGRRMALSKRSSE